MKKYDPTNLRDLMIERDISALRLSKIIGIHRETIGKHLAGTAEFSGGCYGSLPIILTCRQISF